MTNGLDCDAIKSIEMLRERKKKYFKYLGILDADIIKQAEMKEKKCLKRITEEQNDFSRQNSLVENSSKE